MIDRDAVRRAYRPDEERVVAERLNQARLNRPELRDSAAIARSLV